MQENTYIQLPAKAWHKFAKLLLKICSLSICFTIYMFFMIFLVSVFCNLTYKRYLGPSRVATEGSLAKIWWLTFITWSLWYMRHISYFLATQKCLLKGLDGNCKCIAIGQSYSKVPKKESFQRQLRWNW